VQPGVDDAQLATWTQGSALISAALDACKAQGVVFRLVDARGARVDDLASLRTDR
jgi:hypothetical protein